MDDVSGLTWPQIIRVLAGRPPGAPDVPDTDLPIQPPQLMGLLAEGAGVITGVPFHKRLPEPVPASAWPRVRVELWTRPAVVPPGHVFGTVAVLPPPVRGGRADETEGWHDLHATAAEVAKLRVGLQRRAAPAASAGQVSGTAAGAARPRATTPKYRGYEQDDQPIIEKITQDIESGAYKSTWAAVQAIPGNEIAGSGAEESRRRRIYNKIPKFADRYSRRLII